MEIGRLNVTGSRLKLIDIINRYHGSDSLSTIHMWQVAAANRMCIILLLSIVDVHGDVVVSVKTA